MKVAMAVPALVASAWLAQAGSDDAEKTYFEFSKAMQDLTAVLKTVKDKTTAEGAVAKVEAPAKRLGEAVKTAKRLQEAGKLVISEKYSKQLMEDSLAFKAEVDRVTKDADLGAILNKSEAWKQLSTQFADDKVQRAKVEVVVLEKAVQAYKLANGNFPDSLQALTQGKAYIQAGGLNDPWGRPYQYEPNTVDAKTGAPLIYSTGPDPKDKKGHIRNWNP